MPSLILDLFFINSTVLIQYALIFSVIKHCISVKNQKFLFLNLSMICPVCQNRTNRYSCRQKSLSISRKSQMNHIHMYFKELNHFLFQKLYKRFRLNMYCTSISYKPFLHPNYKKPIVQSLKIAHTVKHTAILLTSPTAIT